MPLQLTYLIVSQRFPKMQNKLENFSEASPLSHLDHQGNANMVDVSAKAETIREATAQAIVRMQPATLTAIESGNAPKGDVLGTARVAGIMAAKQTSNLIPLCHPLPIQKVTVEFIADPAIPGYRIEATVRISGKTGVEMEAMTAASVAALTLYDMAKAIEKSIRIESIVLLRKTGGKSGEYIAANP
ncbi:MAG: hypothetical protein RLZZ511_1519 [Cyanobacteriota bacterium]